MPALGGIHDHDPTNASGAIENNPGAREVPPRLVISHIFAAPAVGPTRGEAEAMGEVFLIVAAEGDLAGMHHIGGTPLGGSSLPPLPPGVRWGRHWVGSQ